MLFRLLAVVLGAVLAAAAALRQSMSEDGISYLDMGDAFLRGDWAMAINAVWSPLYSWILGTAMWIVAPSPRWEIPLVHLVNFGIYVLALICFGFFWRRLIDVARRDAPDERAGFPEWVWISVGYALFIWSSLVLVRIWAVTPDMLLAALVYVAAGLLLDLGAGGARRRAWAAYGLVLGLGYLTKAVLFPIGFVFLLLAVLVQRDRRRGLVGGTLALAVFLLVALPFVAAVSNAKGRPTFGETGRLAYLRYVNHVPYPFWTPEAPSDLGQPEHPARLVMEDPPVYEFGTPVGGTYPLSYDPSYWYEGVKTRFTLGEQARVLLTSARWYFELFVRQQAALLAIVAALYLLKGVRRPAAGSRRPAMHVDAPLALTAAAAAAMGLYALVYVEGRYVAPFVVLFWAGILACLRLPESPGTRRLLAVSGSVMAFFVLLNVATFTLSLSQAFLGLESAPPGVPARWPAGPQEADDPPSEVAEGLRELGVGPGDRIGFVGYAFGAYFARLGRMQIVAQIRAQDAAQFWEADPSRREAALEAFARAGARAVVADHTPAGGPPEGWIRVTGTGHWVRLLAPRAASGLRDQVSHGPPEERLRDAAMSGRVPVKIERYVGRTDRRRGVPVVDE